MNANKHILFTTIILTFLSSTVVFSQSPINRDSDPVVIAGDQISDLLGVDVNHIVGFRFDGNWHQIPIQIDEKMWVDFVDVYNNIFPAVRGNGTVAYTDPNTYVGADTDPTFDQDDELVFMVKDSGIRALGCTLLPSGVFDQNSIEIEIYDNLGGKRAYVYLFETDGSLVPDAGADYVTYSFDLLAGSYIPNYNLNNGPNPEDSEVNTPYYRTHFSDRWIRDELNIYVASSDGSDILDRHKNMFSPGNCARTEDTFSAGEGAFFTNIDGPIRAIRSYMGANSGPSTQREHLFYEKRHDVTTFLRVHAISGVMDMYDYGPDAAGMAYYNDFNLGGVSVDGMPDSITSGPINWEMVTGSQGTAMISLIVTTDISPFSYTSYYSDDSTPSVTQCTGDTYEYATSGVWINQPIPNTDPYGGAYNILESSRVVYYEEPNQLVSLAQKRDEQAKNPLEVTVYEYDLCPADFNDSLKIDLVDFSYLAKNWLEINCIDPTWCDRADLDYSGDVDTIDLQILSEYWLTNY